MRTINLADDILAILTQSAKAIPDLFLDFDAERIEVVTTEDAGIFDIVIVESEDEELLVGEIVLDEDLNATFELFETNLEK